MPGTVAVSAKLKENYDAYYEGESTWRTLGAVAKAENITTLCNAVPHSKILDIGAGEGALLKRLSDMNFGDELYALEISRSAVDTTVRRNIPRVCEAQVFDGYTIPYDTLRFDLAILSHVLEHAEYPRKLLYEASRVASYVFVEVPLEDTMMLKSNFIFDSVGHINFYSPKTFRLLAQTCDLRVLSQIVTNPKKDSYRYQFGRRGILKYFVKEFLLRTAGSLAAEFFTYHSALVCTKSSSEIQ